MSASAGSTAVSARIALGLGLFGLVLIGVGSALGLSEAVGGASAFRIFGLGFLFGVLAIVVGILAVLRTRPSSGRGGGNLAWAGLGLGMICFLIVGVAAGFGGLASPPINDITTNLQDPPVFDALAQVEANQGREMAAIDPETARIHGAQYQLRPLNLSVPPAQALDQAKAAAESLGWTVVKVDPAKGTLEATDESEFFHFIDDVVVRVRPANGGSVVDVRSKSREGRGDLGANADRINAFARALRGGS